MGITLSFSLECIKSLKSCTCVLCIMTGARGWRKYPTLCGLMEMVMTG